MQSKATRVEDYLAELPADRRAALTAIREAILSRLPRGYEEGMQYGMIGYYVPHSVYPPGYPANPDQPLPFLALASQAQNMALYAMAVYLDPELEAWFRAAWTATGQKLDMGKSCVRFKRLDQVPLEVVKALVARVPAELLIAQYERGTARKPTRAKPTKAKPTKAKPTKAKPTKAKPTKAKPAATKKAQGKAKASRRRRGSP